KGDGGARGEPGVVRQRVEVDVVLVDVRYVVAGPVELPADERIAGRGVGRDRRGVDLRFGRRSAPIARVRLPLDQGAGVAGEHEWARANWNLDGHGRVLCDLGRHRRLQHVG